MDKIQFTHSEHDDYAEVSLIVLENGQFANPVNLFDEAVTKCELDSHHIAPSQISLIKDGNNCF